MSAKLVFAVGVLGVGGYYGTKMSHFDPTIYPLPRAQVESMLTDARTVLPRRDGPGEIQIWGAERNERGVELNMKYASWAPLLECEAVITTIAPDKTKVVPMCSAGDTRGSAIAQTTDELRTPMFAEHIQATLGKRAFDRKRVDIAEQATVFKNLGGMQHEALQMSDQMQRQQAENQARH